jgi:hypothetical protein
LELKPQLIEAGSRGRQAGGKFLAFPLRSEASAFGLLDMGAVSP